MKMLDEDYWTDNGKKFGYPDCCIKEFVICKTSNNYSMPLKRIPMRVGNRTGFIPCSYCSWKILTKRCELKDLIKNRIFHLPFPEDD